MYRIPEDLFRNNGKLRSVHIEVGGSRGESSNYKVMVPHQLVRHIPLLESLSIRGKVHVEDHKPFTAPLALDPASPLAKHLTPPARTPELWHLSKQYRHLETWNNWDQGADVSVFSGNEDWVDLDDE